MSSVTRDQVRQIAGSIGEAKIAAILATGATVEDIQEAVTLAEGKSEITGMGESTIRGHVMEVLTILSSGTSFQERTT
jgi:hypothetical protein